MMGFKPTTKLIAASLVLVVLFQNCGTQYNLETQTAEISSDGIAGTAGEGPVSPGFTIESQRFSSQTSLKPVDMVWVFDNSYSMREEASHVRSNFTKFMAGLKQNVDIRVAMISSTDNSMNTHVYLPQGTDANNVEINYFVDSFNPLLIAAAATCGPADLTGLCKTIKANSRYNRVVGSLRPFFRQGASKVFVFVTDDDSAAKSETTIQIDQYPSDFRAVDIAKLVENSHYITPATFTQRMDEYFGETSPYKIFGFIAPANTNSNCFSRESTSYMALITQKNGKYFNICDTDWTRNFDSLTSEISMYAQTEYMLGSFDVSRLKRIVSVSLNGTRLVLGTHYTTNGKQISIRPELVQSQTVYSLDVVYELYK